MEIVDRKPSTLGVQQTLELSKDSREALQLALEEAITHGRGYYIDTADLLVGLSQVGTTRQRLAELGINVGRIREIKEQLGGYNYFNRLWPPTPPMAIESWSQLPRTQRMHKIGRMITKRALGAKRELKNLSKEDKIVIGEVVEEIKENPLIGKPLSRELTGKFSYRVGVYRVVYAINRDDILILLEFATF